MRGVGFLSEKCCFGTKCSWSLFCETHHQRICLVPSRSSVIRSDNADTYQGVLLGVVQCQIIPSKFGGPVLYIILNKSHFCGCMRWWELSFSIPLIWSAVDPCPNQRMWGGVCSSVGWVGESSGRWKWVAEFWFQVYPSPWSGLFPSLQREGVVNGESLVLSLISERVHSLISEREFPSSFWVCLSHFECLSCIHTHDYGWRKELNVVTEHCLFQLCDTYEFRTSGPHLPAYQVLMMLFSCYKWASKRLRPFLSHHKGNSCAHVHTFHWNRIHCHKIARRMASLLFPSFCHLASMEDKGDKWTYCIEKYGLDFFLLMIL